MLGDGIPCYEMGHHVRVPSLNALCTLKNKHRQFRLKYLVVVGKKKEFKRRLCSSDEHTVAVPSLHGN